MKAGVDFLYNDVTIVFPGALPGTYTFTSLANLRAWPCSSSSSRPSESRRSSSRIPNLGLFVQDEWRPRPGLTLNAGLRYDLQWLPDPIQLDANNVSPRLGVAWAPGDQQTVVRASAGMYFDRIPLRATSNALQRDGVNYKVAVLSFGQPGAPAFPSRPAVVSFGPPDGHYDHGSDIQNGRSEQLGLQVERGIGGVTVGDGRVTPTCAGTSIIMSRNVNVPTLTAAQASALGVPNLGRPNPNYRRTSASYDSIGDSWFNGFTVSLATRNAAWGSARVVVYAVERRKTRPATPSSARRRTTSTSRREKGPSDNDQRHRLVVSGTIGGSSGRSGWPKLARALAGIQVGYVVVVRDRRAVQRRRRQRSQQRHEQQRSARGRRPEQRAAAGDLVRRSSALAGVQRSVAQRIEVMLEAFNVFNHVNILAVNNTFGTGAMPLPTFGQPTLAGDPRQIQDGGAMELLNKGRSGTLVLLILGVLAPLDAAGPVTLAVPGRVERQRVDGGRGLVCRDCLVGRHAFGPDRHLRGDEPGQR